MVTAKHRLRAAALFLLFAWVVAGVTNANAWFFGSAPTTLGTVATLVAVGAWPVVGWSMGRRALPGFIRLATVSWMLVLIGTPLAYFPAKSTGGETPGTLVLALGYFALAGPLYGVSAILPSWEYWAQAVVIGVVVFAVTLVAYFGARTSGYAPRG